MNRTVAGVAMTSEMRALLRYTEGFTRKEVLGGPGSAYWNTNNDGLKPKYIILLYTLYVLKATIIY